MILTMGGIQFCSHGGSLAVRYLTWLPTYPTPLCKWTHLQKTITTHPQQSTKIHQLHRSHTLNFLHCRRDKWCPLHTTLWSPSPSFLQTNFLAKSFRGQKRWPIWLLWGIEPGLPRRKFVVITTMLPLTGEFPIWQFFYSHYQVQDCNHIHPLSGDMADTFDKYSRSYPWKLAGEMLPSRSGI